MLPDKINTVGSKVMGRERCVACIFWQYGTVYCNLQRADLGTSVRSSSRGDPIHNTVCKCCKRHASWHIGICMPLHVMCVR